MKTDTGHALNDLLAKGRNNMNILLEIFIRWRSHHIGINTDVSKMYNTVPPESSQWWLQRYQWEDTLDPSRPPEENVIKTCIYGLKSSGNQSERALRQTASSFKEKHPDIHDIVNNDVYVTIVWQAMKPSDKHSKQLIILKMLSTMVDFLWKDSLSPHKSPMRRYQMMGRQFLLLVWNGSRNLITSASTAQRSTLLRSIVGRSPNRF